MLMLRASAFLLLPALIHAQTGTEVVFVGTSVGGSTDPHFFANQISSTVLASGGNTFTDNVTDAVWADQGTNLYASLSIRPQVSRAVWNGSAATWSVLYNAPGACYGLGLDRDRQLLWVLTGSTGTNRELVCLDANPSNVTYGTALTQTGVLTGVSRERWELSPTGNMAAVPHAFLGLFQVVDTNPLSPTFLQVIASQPVTGATGGFTLASACAISRYDTFAYVVYSGLGTQGLAVMVIGSQAWLDFDPNTPGQQDYVIPLPVPNRMALSADDRFVAISGQGGGGWAARLDIDYQNPGNSVWTTYTAPLGLPNCNGVSLSADSTRMAVTATPVNLASPSYLALFDVQSGANLQYITLPGAWNVYTTAWQDLRPNASFTPYGAGCAGSAGVPTLTSNAPPRPGTAISLIAGNIPAAIAFVGLGFSDTTYGSFTLPMPLGSIGMTGCTLFAAPESVNAIVGSPTASLIVSIPFRSQLYGTVFFGQAFPFDTPANPAGLTASNGLRLTIGL